jgi:iron complex transport system ATP-binding protein
MRAAPLAFEDITFGYDPGGAPVLDGLSIAFPAASVTAILGPNGAGKTTLLLLALGWLAPRGGRVLLDGRPLREHSRREAGRRMALVPQTERMPFNYTVADYALMGRSPYLAPLAAPGPSDLAATRRGLARAGIASLAGRPITTLSAGERQLVLVARALAQEPAILLLDEPTAHLDLANKVRIISLVHALSADGVTVVMTTHEPEVASAASHLVLLRDGRVRRAGTVDEVFTSDCLSDAYGIPVHVSEVEGRRVAAWVPRP